MRTISALIVSAEDLAVIAALNADEPLNKLQPAVAADDRLFLPVNLLADCGPGQTWERFSTLLHTLSTETVTLKEYPED